MGVLELVILTAARTKEVLQAPSSEFDLEQRLWTVPAECMKGGREHRVPLPAAALAILEEQATIRNNDYVFPGSCGAKHTGQNLLLQTLQRLGCSELTAHGFRSIFFDWCAANQLPLRGPRDGIGPRRQQQGRGGLGARRFVRQASQGWLAPGRVTARPPRPARSWRSPVAGKRRDCGTKHGRHR